MAKERMDKTMKQLEGKVALVTGATSGMGAAAAQTMAEEGAAMILAGRREGQGGQIAKEIRSQGGNALFVQTDVTVEDQVARLVVYLASDAASFISGAAIPIDGGETAGVAARREED